jgi:hypothetical protein
MDAWHLTPRGWEKTPMKWAPPYDRVLTCTCSTERAEAWGETRPVINVIWEMRDHDATKKLLSTYGHCPASDTWPNRARFRVTQEGEVVDTGVVIRQGPQQTTALEKAEHAVHDTLHLAHAFELVRKLLGWG